MKRGLGALITLAMQAMKDEQKRSTENFEVVRDRFRRASVEQVQSTTGAESEGQQIKGTGTDASVMPQRRAVASEEQGADFGWEQTMEEKIALSRRCRFAGSALTPPETGASPRRSQAWTAEQVDQAADPANNFTQTTRGTATTIAINSIRITLTAAPSRTIVVGMTVIAAGIPTGAVVMAVASQTSLVITAATTAEIMAGATIYFSTTLYGQRIGADGDPRTTKLRTPRYGLDSLEGWARKKPSEWRESLHDSLESIVSYDQLVDLSERLWTKITTDTNGCNRKMDYDLLRYEEDEYKYTILMWVKEERDRAKIRRSRKCRFYQGSFFLAVSALDKNHSHYVLIDDQSFGERGTETHFRVDLLDMIGATAMLPSRFDGYGREVLIRAFRSRSEGHKIRPRPKRI